MVQELKCPKCGSIDCIIDTGDYGLSATLDEVRFYFEGYCKHCNTNLHWTECYAFAGYDEIGESQRGEGE